MALTIFVSCLLCLSPSLTSRFQCVTSRDVAEDDRTVRKSVPECRPTAAGDTVHTDLCDCGLWGGVSGGISTRLPRRWRSWVLVSLIVHFWSRAALSCFAMSGLTLSVAHLWHVHTKTIRVYTGARVRLLVCYHWVSLYVVAGGFMKHWTRSRCFTDADYDIPSLIIGKSQRLVPLHELIADFSMLRQISQALVVKLLMLSAHCECILGDCFIIFSDTMIVACFNSASMYIGQRSRPSREKRKLFRLLFHLYFVFATFLF